MKEENRQYEYVIGFDIGHGETSAAICPIQWDKPVDQLDPVTDLTMGGNNKVIPSAITILDDGRAFIGELAFNPDILTQASVNVCFKQAPRFLEGEKEKIMIRFMEELYKRIRENNVGLLTDSNHLCYIATPSGWDASMQRVYVEMARRAGMPILQNGITKESRAAFVRAQKDQTSGIAKHLEKGVVVFDFGSSTLDFTYMSINDSNLVDFGYDCGASKIETLMLEEHQLNNKAVDTFIQQYPRLRHYLLFEVRKCKEGIYFNPTMRFRRSINFADFLDDENFVNEVFRLDYHPGDLDEMLKSKGYVTEIANAMKDFREKHIPGKKIHGVYLTGGASRMDFVKELVTTCWDVAVEDIYQDQNPSLTISQGVAEVARLDLRTEGVDTGLAEMMDALMDGSIIYNRFINSFGERLTNEIVQAVKESINDFGSSTEDKSLNDLAESIKISINNTVGISSKGETEENQKKNVSSLASEQLLLSIDMEMGEITAKVNDIVAHYSKFNQQIVVKKPELPSINMDDVMAQVMGEIKADAGWGAVLGGGAIGAVLAALLSGPFFIFVLAGLIWGVIIGASDKQEEKAKAKKLSIKKRVKVRDTMLKEISRIEADVRKSIDENILKNDELKKTVTKHVVELLHNYRQQLKDVRIIID